MSRKEYLGYEAGPIRPPSEAYSLLLRLVRGCSWNRCKFCGFYRGIPFSLRPAAHVIADIDAFKTWIDVFEGKTKKEIATEADYEAYYMAASWYQAGMESVFFQDGNALLMRPNDMIAILEHLNKTFPQVQRITTYARSDAIARVPDEYLKRYNELGLNRFHVGMETGNDQLLTMTNKGVDKATQILAGQKAVKAGIEVSEFYMPGLGGKEYGNQSADDTADAMNQINPDFIRIRTMALSPKLDIQEDYDKGIYTRTNDMDDVREIRRFISQLEGITSMVESDHILNILINLKGKLPEDKPKMLAMIDEFLDLPPEEQLLFRLGRRIGVMADVSDLRYLPRRRQVESVMAQNGINQDNIDHLSQQLMIRAIPV